MNLNLTTVVKQNLITILSRYSQWQHIIKAIHNAGGTTYLVGGAVRDLLLSLPVKDLDIEVHGLDLEQLESILQQFGPVDTVGKSFGVLRIHPYDIDWSVPRADEPGRKPKVIMDPEMDFKKASSRRDLTINAMGINLTSFQLHDPFGGLNDLKEKVLRAPDPEKFIEDPLRFFRVMQFCARFGFKPDNQLNQLCTTMDLSGVSKERIETECKKWLLRSNKPSVALDWLEEIGRLTELFPELAALQGVEQNEEWHPEGDVYEHTKQTLDAAAIQEYADDHEKLILMYAALCHDLGKATVTSKNEDGSIISYGHENESEVLAKQLLNRITTHKELISNVAKLVKLHMRPGQLINQQASLSAYKRLARKLAPHLSMDMLAKLFLVDRLGRNPKKGVPLSKANGEVIEFKKKIKEAEIEHKPEEPVLKGRDLLEYFTPGQELGEALKAGYEFQIENNTQNKEKIKQFVLKTFNKS